MWGHGHTGPNGNNLPVMIKDGRKGKEEGEKRKEKERKINWSSDRLIDRDWVAGGYRRGMENWLMSIVGEKKNNFN